ncbi:MAG: hypothetical protein ACLGH3_07935 [Actinomycetota bacterium]
MVEQSWELLSEIVEGIATSSTVEIARGVLPGGSSKFAPVPSVKLVVVGRHVGGTGASAAYKVSLRTGIGGVIGGAEVSFPASGNLNPSWSVREMDFAWPGFDIGLGSLKVDRINGTGLAGTFDLRKAYLLISQTGSPTKLISRFPLGSAQQAMTDLNWGDLAEPGFYKHVASDLGAGAVLRLRASAQAGDRAELQMRLVRCGGAIAPGDCSASGPLVSSSSLTFDDPVLTSAETSGLSLEDGWLYKVQAKVIDLSATAGPQQNSTGAPAPGAANQSSAELVIEQSTLDSGGLAKALVFVPSVTKGRVANQSDGLGFGFLKPALIAPPCASSSTTWESVARRDAGTGTVEVPMVISGATSATVAGSASSNTAFRAPVSKAVGDAYHEVSAGTVMDSYVRLTGAGTVGRVSQSGLRIAACLRDTVAPTISSFEGMDGLIFSTRADSNRRAARFRFDGSDDFSYPLRYAIEIRDSSNTLRRTLSGQGDQTSLTISRNDVEWDGRDDLGTLLGAGNYSATLKLTDSAGLVTTSADPLDVTIDVTPPAVPTATLSIDGISCTTGCAFSPNQPLGDGVKDTIVASSNFAETVTWELTYAKAAPNPSQQTLTGGPSTVLGRSWDGRNSVGSVIEGNYTPTLVVRDLAGNPASLTLPSVGLDITKPTVSGSWWSNNRFSPNADGRKDTTQLLGSFSETVNWNLNIAPHAGSLTLRTVTGSGTTPGYIWDGYGCPSGPPNCSTPVVLAEGQYRGQLTGTDAAGNTSNTSTIYTTIDLTRPVVTNFVASNPAFSTAPGSIKPTTRYTWTTSEPLDSTTRLVIRNSNDQIVKQLTNAASGTTWNGRDNTNELLPEGTYTITLETAAPASLGAEDQAGNPSLPIPTTTTTIDLTPPEPFTLNISEPRISPNEDGQYDSTRLTAGGADWEQWSLVIRPGTAPAVGWTQVMGTNIDRTWDGKDAAGGTQEGAATVTATAYDPAGNPRILETSIVVDVSPPVVAQALVFTTGGLQCGDVCAFSPNDDGIKDSVTFSDGVVTDEWTEVSWSLSFVGIDSATIAGDGNLVSGAWDGFGGNGALPDGIYGPELHVQDAVGNRATFALDPIVLDTIAPYVPAHALLPLNNSSVPSGEHVARAIVGEMNRVGSHAVFELVAAGQAQISDVELVSGQTAVVSRPFDIEAGLDYTLTVSVIDAAGNMSGTLGEVVSRFAGVDASVGASFAEIESSPCTLSPLVVGALTRTATCSDAQVDLDTGPLTISRSGTTGQILTRFETDLEDAYLVGQLPTQNVAAYDAGTAPRVSEVASTWVSRADLPISAAVDDLEVPVAPVAREVPSHWTEASLVMTPKPMSSRVERCPNPADVCASDVVRRVRRVVLDPPLSATELQGLPTVPVSTHILLEWVPSNSDPDREFGGGVILSGATSETETLRRWLSASVYKHAKAYRDDIEAWADQEELDYLDSVLGHSAPFRVAGFERVLSSSAQVDEFLDTILSDFGARATPEVLTPKEEVADEAPDPSKWAPDEGYWNFQRVFPVIPYLNGMPPGDSRFDYQYSVGVTMKWMTAERLSAFTSDSAFEVNAPVSFKEIPSPYVSVCRQPGAYGHPSYCDPFVDDWSSNLPGKYLEAITFDDDVRTLGIGTHEPDRIKHYREGGSSRQNSYFAQWDISAPVDYDVNANRPVQWLYGQIDVSMSCLPFIACGDYAVYSDPPADRLITSCYNWTFPVPNHRYVNSPPGGC